MKNEELVEVHSTRSQVREFMVRHGLHLLAILFEEDHGRDWILLFLKKKCILRDIIFKTYF